MRHRVKSTRLNRPKNQLRALMRNLVTSLVLFEQVETTRDKAKLAQGFIDRLIVTAKRKDKLNAIRYVSSFVLDKNASIKIIDELTTRYADRDSGFTRVVNSRVRTGDGAQMVIFQLV